MGLIQNYYNTGPKKFIVYTLLIIIYGAIIYVLIQGPATIGDKPDDFVGYWSAGRLIAYQENPYSLVNFIDIFQELTFSTIILLPVYYPPTVMPFLLPFGLISYPISRYIWLLISLSIIFFCGISIWKIYRGPKANRWVAILCILSLAPVYLSLIEGQITFLILLGITGFLYFIEQKKSFIAGLFLALLSIKFQLVYLIWVVLFLWAISYKQWKILVGFISLSSILIAISIIMHQSILQDYIFFIVNYSPSHCGYSSLSAIFCIAGGIGFKWFRYIPGILGFAWVFFYYFPHQRNWIWKERISLILIVSVMTAPFSWMHDQILFLIPIIEIAVLLSERKFDKRGYSIIMLYMFINVIAFLLIPWIRFRQILFIWMPVTFLILYLSSKRYLISITPIEIDD